MDFARAVMYRILERTANAIPAWIKQYAWVDDVVQRCEGNWRLIVAGFAQAGAAFRDECRANHLSLASKSGTIGTAPGLAIAIRDAHAVHEIVGKTLETGNATGLDRGRVMHGRPNKT